MDPQDALIPMAVAVERKRQEKRRMKVALRVSQAAVKKKKRERAILLRKKQAMLSKEDAKQKLLNDCLVFIEAIENNDLEKAQKFDEKETMSTILTMINSNDSNGGCGDEMEEFPVIKEEVLITPLVVVAMEGTKCDGSC